MTTDRSVARYEEIMKTKKFLPFQMGYLTEEMVERAAEELGESETVKAKALAELRSMLDKETKLVCPQDDAYLLEYLRPRKYNVKKAFQLMQNYHQIKKSYGDFYSYYDPDLMRRMFAVRVFYCLPYRDSDGCVILVLNLSRWDPDEFPLNQGVILLTSVLLRCVEDPATGVCGLRIFIDCKHVCLKQIKQITPRFMTLFSRALRNCLPARFRGIHIYNESVIFQYMWSVFKLFLSEKIKKRVHFYGDNQKQLHKHIPKAILPTEYGGDNPQDIGEWFINEMEQYCERYGELTTYGYRD